MRARVKRPEGVRGLGSSDVLGLRALKVHEVGLGFPKVHADIKGTRESFNSTPE